MAVSAAGLILCAAAPAGRAEVKLSPLFGENAVLQRGTKVPLWGTATAGEEITVAIAGQRKTATVGPDGRWRAVLDPQEAGGPFDMVVTGKNTLTVRNVLFGEVWLCSGQSNMGWPVAGARDPEKEISQADYPSIRFFMVRDEATPQIQAQLTGRWQVCSPKTIGAFSATAYYYGRELHKALGVPVGLIHASLSGTPCEAWMSRAAVEADPDFKPIFDRWQAASAENAKAKPAFDAKRAEWEKAAAQAKAEGRTPPPRPEQILGWGDPKRSPGWLYNGTIAPIIPTAIRGAIWYQGEENATTYRDARIYRKLFPALIRDWRTAWGQGDFPFLFVQLPNYGKVLPQPSECIWSELREAQAMALRLPNTGMAVAIDIGEAENGHPKNKQEVGQRLALVAQGLVYGKPVTFSGPAYDGMSIEGNRIRLRFRNAAGGLVAAGGGDLKGFAVAGEDRKYVWAKAKIEGDTVVVWNDPTPHPVAIRYAWAENPECNLSNPSGLPASPFRTDDWPGPTDGRP